jgi:hypothetical protein
MDKSADEEIGSLAGTIDTEQAQAHHRQAIQMMVRVAIGFSRCF